MQFNTEFTSILHDESALKTTIHFQIPADRNDAIEQLNRTTERLLLIFVGWRLSAAVDAMNQAQKQQQQQQQQQK